MSTVYFSDGTKEVILDNPEQDLKSIIVEKLGDDCANLYDAVLENLRDSNSLLKDECSEHERSADGYREELYTTMLELERILDQFQAAKINRNKLYNSLMRLYKNINSCL